MKQELKLKQIEGHPSYYIRQDGVVINVHNNKVAKVYKTGPNKKTSSVIIYCPKIKKCTTLSIKHLLKVYFGQKDQLPEIEGIEHKPMLGYQGRYQIYSNGQVWSRLHDRWLVACYQSKGRYLLYCLQDANGKIKTQYLHRLLAENFIVNSPINGLIVHHKDHNTKNNSLENLEVLTPLEHELFHKGKKEHSPQWLEKKAAKEKEQAQRKPRPKHYKHSAQYLTKKAAKEKEQAKMKGYTNE